MTLPQERRAKRRAQRAKVEALARYGVGGEADNARALLERMDRQDARPVVARPAPRPRIIIITDEERAAARAEALRELNEVLAND